MKKIMILGAGPLQVPAIQKAKELGYHVIAVDYDESAVGFALADTRLVVSTTDREEVYRQARILEPDVIITSASDAPVRTVAYVNQRLGLRRGLSYEDALCATNKAFMRKRLRENNVPIPEFYVVDNMEEYRAAVSHFAESYIVKPADNAGSRGVKLVQRKEKENRDDAYFYSKSFSRTGTLLVEEFLQGPEVSVESFTVDGKTSVIAITDKSTTRPPFFVEIGHCEPSRLSETVKEQIRGITVSAVNAIHIKNGPSHTEVKITKDGPKIVEIAARLGGDFIASRLVPLSTGVDLVGNSVLEAVGEPVDLSVTKGRGAAIRFLSSGSGILRSIRKVDEAKAIPGVEEVQIYKKPGEPVHALESSSDRIGHVIACADTPEQADEICERAWSLIQIEVSHPNF